MDKPLDFQRAKESRRLLGFSVDLYINGIR